MFIHCEVQLNFNHLYLITQYNCFFLNKTFSYKIKIKQFSNKFNDDLMIIINSK